jgi:hypothetical protein
MKNIFAKQYNLLFLAAGLILAQFISAIFFAYLQILDLLNIAEFTFYIYIFYCAAICASCVIFVIKKPEFAYAKLWFSGLFLYMFCEILFYAKLFITAYKDIPGFSLWEPNYERTITTYNLYDGQPFFRLFLCLALIFAIYIFLFVFEKKRVYLGFAGAHLIITSLFIILEPASFYIESDYALDILIYSAAKEAALIIIFINLLVSAFYLLYKQEN